MLRIADLIVSIRTHIFNGSFIKKLVNKYNEFSIITQN